MLGLGAPPTSGAAFNPDDMLAEVLRTAGPGGSPLDLTIPKNFNDAKAAVNKLVDALPFDLSSAVPGGAGIVGAAPTVVSVVNSAARGDWKGAATTLIGAAGIAACGPPCAAVASFAGNILVQAAPVIVDAVKISFGGQSALTSELRDRAAQLQGEAQAAANSFVRNKDLALQSLEAAEKAMCDGARQAAADTFARINNVPGYTDPQSSLSALLARNPGKSADSLVDPRNPKGPTFAQQADADASAANRAAISRSGLSSEFQRVLSSTIGQLDTARYRWRPVDGKNFNGSTYWWKNMPPDKFANPFGKKVKIGNMNLPADLVEYDYPATDDQGQPYDALCKLTSFRSRNAEGIRVPGVWAGTDTRAWIPLNRAPDDLWAFNKDSRLKPDSSDASSELVDLYNSTWEGRERGRQSRDVVEQNIAGITVSQAAEYPQVVQAQWRRLSCVLQARLRTFRAFTQLALGRFSKEALRETLNRSLQKASKQRAADAKNHTGLAVGFALVAVAGAVALVAMKRKKMKPNRRRRHVRR